MRVHSVFSCSSSKHINWISSITKCTAYLCTDQTRFCEERNPALLDGLLWSYKRDLCQHTWFRAESYINTPLIYHCLYISRECRSSTKSSTTLAVRESFMASPIASTFTPVTQLHAYEYHPSHQQPHRLAWRHLTSIMHLSCRSLIQLHRNRRRNPASEPSPALQF